MQTKRFYDMRVITGSARGRKLKTLDSLDIRPTPDAVKEAIFSVVQFDLPTASVLDLFAGSGQLGIEALSRGAAHCVFVDQNPDAVAVIKENLNACKLMSSARVLNMDSIEYIKVAKTGLDMAFLDPPYRHGLLEKVLPLISKKLNEGAFVICEHEAELTLPDEYEGLYLHKRYRYGKVAVTVYRTPQSEDEL
nr:MULTISPECIES: 16S rRNA (guanine(966)-N(2))-methyltransferase RsmD [unclassified Ruminococcus]